MNVKIAIVGSRTFNNYELLKKTIDEFINYNNFTITSIISGGCRGTDLLAERYSIEHHIDLKTLKPDWSKYGKNAGIIRNHDIIKTCDVCLAFWLKGSKGTEHDIRLCSQYKKPCWVFDIDEKRLYESH